MEVIKDEYKNFMLWFVDKLESMEKQLIAHAAILLTLKVSGRITQEEIDGLLDQGKKGAGPLTEKKYQEMRSTISTLLDEADFHQAVEKLLRNWTPTGVPN